MCNCRTVSLITPLTRKFSPMKEDADNLTREISMSKGEKKKEEESAIDFLDEDEDMDYGERIIITLNTIALWYFA